MIFVIAVVTLNLEDKLNVYILRCTSQRFQKRSTLESETKDLVESTCKCSGFNISYAGRFSPTLDGQLVLDSRSTPVIPR